MKTYIMANLVNNVETKVSALQSVFAGGASGAITRAIAQPLDVLKIRFQLQLEPIKAGSKYSSIFQALTSIIKEEGVSALWSGHVPAQVLSVSYGILQFATFEKLTSISRENGQFFSAHKHWINFSNGAIAATIATVATFPLDTVRTRLIAEQKNEKVYKGFVNAFHSIFKTEGTQALFRGLVPTLGQIAPHAGIQFSVYKLFSEDILNRIEYFQRRSNLISVVESSLLGNLIAGSVAGFISKTAIYPFDLIKKRLQIQGFQQHRKSFGKQMYCKGSIDCIRITVSEEGLLALYKGYWPSMLKAMLVSALHFAVYSEIKHYLVKKQQ